MIVLIMPTVVWLDYHASVVSGICDLTKPRFCVREVGKLLTCAFSVSNA